MAPASGILNNVVMTHPTMPSTTADVTTKGPLQPPALIVLGLQILFALGFGVMGMIASSGDEGFADLGRIIVAMMVIAWLVGLGIAWVIARYALKGTTPRVIFLLFGPGLPLLALIAAARFG